MGALTQFKVNWHQLDDTDRLQLLHYTQLKLLEYLALHNQNLQLDPVLVHLRMIALLQKWGTPNYGNCIAIINEIKKRTKQHQLSAALLYLVIQPVAYPKEESDLTTHVKEFFNMLIENKLAEYEIGPPFSAESCLPDEKLVWTTYAKVQEDINLQMSVANIANSNERLRLKWTAGKLFL